MERKNKRRSKNLVLQNGEMLDETFGQFINSVILDHKRAVYGKKILTELSSKLS